MATYTKGIDLYRAQKALLEKHRADAKKGHAMLSSAAKKDLQELLSGRYTRKQTRGAFARHPRIAPDGPPGRRRDLSARQLANRALPGQLPLNPINIQSGDLERGARLRKGNRGAQSYRLVVSGKAAAYAGYVLGIGGTSKMVARGVKPELERRWRPRNKALLDHLAQVATP